MKTEQEPADLDALNQQMADGAAHAAHMSDTRGTYQVGRRNDDPTPPGVGIATPGAEHGADIHDRTCLCETCRQHRDLDYRSRLASRVERTLDAGRVLPIEQRSGRLAYFRHGADLYVTASRCDCAEITLYNMSSDPGVHDTRFVLFDCAEHGKYESLASRCVAPSENRSGPECAFDRTFPIRRQGVIAWGVSRGSS